MPLEYIPHVFRVISKKKILAFESQIEKIELFNPPFTYNLSSKHA